MLWNVLVHRALIDRRAFHVANFFLDDPVVVLDHADIAGLILANDELIDLFRSGRHLHNGFGVDDARLVDIMAGLYALGAVIALRRRATWGVLGGSVDSAVGTGRPRARRSGRGVG